MSAAQVVPRDPRTESAMFECERLFSEAVALAERHGFSVVCVAVPAMQNLDDHLVYVRGRPDDLMLLSGMVVHKVFASATFQDVTVLPRKGVSS